MNDSVPPETTIDARPPAVAVRAFDGSRVAGTSVDDVSGVAKVRVTISNSLGEEATYEPALTCTARRLSCTWEATATGLPGRYTVEAWAIDGFGNEEPAAARATFIAI